MCYPPLLTPPLALRSNSGFWRSLCFFLVCFSSFFLDLKGGSHWSHIQVLPPSCLGFWAGGEVKYVSEAVAIVGSLFCHSVCNFCKIIINVAGWLWFFECPSHMLVTWHSKKKIYPQLYVGRAKYKYVCLLASLLSDWLNEYMTYWTVLWLDS